MAKHVVITADLVKLARNEVEFLHEVDNQLELKAEHSIRRAIWRYEKFWLPLVVGHQTSSSQVLVPPLDVHWVWHCHLLCPRQYLKDCTALVGRLVEHEVLQIFNSPEYKRQAEATEQLWAAKYGLVEQYHVSHYEVVPIEVLVYQSKCGYDLLQATARQSSFYYNVSLPHYRDDKFLAAAVERYKKYLLLIKNNSSSFIVPCYDIDLMWHTHQLMTKAYYEDTGTILGYVLNHDDTDTDRRPGSKLSDSFLKSRQLWQTAYNEEYTIAGAMYRGPPCAGKLHAITAGQRQVLTTKVMLTNVKLEGVDDDVSKVKMKVKTVADCTKLVSKFKGPPPYVWNNFTSGVSTFEVDTRKKKVSLLFEAQTLKGTCLFVSNAKCYNFIYGDLEAEIEATQSVARTSSILLEPIKATRDSAVLGAVEIRR